MSNIKWKSQILNKKGYYMLSKNLCSYTKIQNVKRKLYIVIKYNKRMK